MKQPTVDEVLALNAGDTWKLLAAMTDPAVAAAGFSKKYTDDVTLTLTALARTKERAESAEQQRPLPSRVGTNHRDGPSS